MGTPLGGAGAPVDPAIMLSGVSVAFRRAQEEIIAMDSVDFTATRGSLVAIMGASGSGKSTLLNCVGGLQEADSGTVVIEGAPLTSMTDDERADFRLEHVGLVFQDDNLVPVFSALENVTLPLRARGWDAARADEEGRRWLERVGIGSLAERRPAEMSGGQRQRVGIARAVAGGRRVLLADEPTGALDSSTTAEVLALLRELAHEDACVVVVSHDPAVREHADEVLWMSDGRLSMDGWRG